TREALDDAVEALKQEGRDKLRKQSRAKDDSNTALDDAVEALKQEGRDKLRKQSRAKDDSNTAVGIGTGAIAVTTLLNDNIWVILAGIALIVAGGILIYLNRKDD
ncbi:MAG: LPXTG cell wall anchor domain-containing protein, partial [Hyphomicrobiales bacterium]